MDNAGNNRYELLFMDDDISDPLDNIVVKTKKQAKTAAGGAAGGAGPKSANKQSAEGNKATGTKKPNQAEKENKPSALNKNEANKKSAAAADKSNKQGGAGAGAGAGGAAATTAPVGGASANRKRNNGEAREGGGQGQGQGQGPRNVNFRQQNGETREQRNNRRNTRDSTFSSAGQVAGGGGGDGQARPLRGDRGQARNRNFEASNRKREFDRQSGSDRTGVKSVDKRDGAGAHNWGSMKEAIDDVHKADMDSGTTGAGEKSDESGNEQVAEQSPVEEETKELTLDEWKAQKQQRVKPTFNIRKAGEGEDTSQWKKMIVLNNKKKETESEEELEFDPAMYPQRVGRQQRVLDIQFNFNDGRRIGGGFGGRGRGRGGPRVGGGGGSGGGGGGSGGAGGPIANSNGERFAGGRGGNAAGGRGGKRQFGGDRHQQNAAPKVNDERQFPTLA